MIAVFRVLSNVGRFTKTVTEPQDKKNGALFSLFWSLTDGDFSTQMARRRFYKWPDPAVLEKKIDSVR